MAIFSRVKKSRQAAKEHKEKQAEQVKKDEVKPAYRHIPSHAAIDALNCTPQAWRHEDAPRIMEANRRHSERAASGYGRVSSFMSLNAAQFHSMPGTPALGSAPRVSSSLSHVAFPSGYHNPVVQMPRSYSVQSLSPTMGWNRSFGGEPSPYLRRVDTDGPPMRSFKGKGKAADRSSAISELGPVGVNPYSSSDSTSSQDELEIPGGSSKHARAESNGSQTSQAAKPSTSGRPHRLHPARRISDPSAFSPTKSSHQLSLRTDTYYPPSASAGRSGPRRPNGRTPTSTTPSTSNNIPPVPIPPRGLVTASSNSLSSSNSEGTSRSAEPVDTPATAPSPEISPTQKINPGSFKFGNDEQTPAETYADIIPDFAPLGQGLAEPAPKVTSEPKALARAAQRTHRPTTRDSEQGRVTNFSRLSIRSNSSLSREAPQSSLPVPVKSNTAISASQALLQEPTHIRHPPRHSSMAYERSSMVPSSLPTRFIESGFDEQAPRPAPKPPTSLPVPAPVSAKKGKLTKRSAVASAPKDKEVVVEKKKSRWGRK